MNEKEVVFFLKGEDFNGHQSMFWSELCTYCFAPNSMLVWCSVFWPWSKEIVCSTELERHELCQSINWGWISKCCPTWSSAPL
jgi:hypothetical protein